MNIEFSFCLNCFHLRLSKRRTIYNVHWIFDAWIFHKATACKHSGWKWLCRNRKSRRAFVCRCGGKSLKIWPFPPAPLCVPFSITGLQYLSNAFSIIILRRNGCIHYQNAFHKKKKIWGMFEKNEGLWSLILIIHFVFKCSPPAWSKNISFRGR